MKRFKNKLSLITGGSKGIGKAISLGLAEESSDILITYFRDKKNALKTKDEIIKLGVNCDIIKINLSNIGSVEEMTNYIKDKFKKIDFLINNAATGINKPSKSITSKHWDFVINTNSKAPWILIKNLSEIMPSGSSVVNISSLGSKIVLSNYFSVGVSKSALETITKYLSIELSEKGIKVNSISPGIIKTDALKSFPKGSDVRNIENYDTPAGKPLEAKNVSDLVNFLCSDESEMIRGQNITIDGGRSLTT